MIKKFSAIFLCICLLAGCFAACSDEAETADTAGGLSDIPLPFFMRTGKHMFLTPRAIRPAK